jgi:hypothetical protein
MFAQFAGGRPKPKNSDTAMTRFSWFKQCLAAVVRMAPPSARSLALPYNIGCGLAGGRWDVYWGELVRFAGLHPDWQIVLYRLPGTGLLEEDGSDDGGAAAAAAAD